MFSSTRTFRFVVPAIALLLIGFAAGCDSSSDAGPLFPGITLDADEQPDTQGSAADGSADGRGFPDGTDVSVTRVDVDLRQFVESRTPGSSSARAYRADGQTEFPEGPNVRARPGDYVVENERIQLFVERRDESISPCSYGANPVDAVYKTDDGTRHGDVLGEICPLINAGLTVKPVEFEIVRDGSQTGVAAVAATGVIRRLDFLNLRTMAPDAFASLIDQVPFEPSGILPLTVTIYYVLEHGTNDVQMVTAFRNDGDEEQHVMFGHLVKSGGNGDVFNPLNQQRGFGPDSISENNVSGTPLPFTAFTGVEGSFAYIPEPDPKLSADLPVAGRTVSQSGVGITFLGLSDVVGTLLSKREEFETADGILHLDPGESTTRRQYIAIGDSSLSSVIDGAYRHLGVDRGALRGTVRSPDGSPLEDVTVTAVSDNRAINQARTDSDGRYAMDVPPGSYRLLARAPGRTASEAGIELEADERSRNDFTLPFPARLEVAVEAPSGQSVPARISVECVGNCPDPPTSMERDVKSDSLPDKHAAIEPTAPDGTATLELQPGTYRVSVTRGLEWSIWPADAPSNGGKEVVLKAGETESLSAEIARVVETSGALGGDFHVHGVRSADSVVTKRDRVMNFVSEGVDVLVSTDHDAITDYRPTVENLGVGDEIVALRGDEITTSDIGHFNAFPLPHDSTHRAGGALDWGRGPNLNLPPAGIYSWVHDQPGRQVMQINHPASETSGLIRMMEADVLHGTTHADTEYLRLPGGERDPDTGDTGYWSDNFTAIELMNGTSVSDFWPLARWWLTMIGRGFSPTGTAVTDTHELYSDLGGTPRTYAFVGASHDSPGSFDRETYIKAVNQGRAIGTNGPYFTVEARNGNGDRAPLGSTLEAHDGGVTLEVRIDVPVWMNVDRVDIFSNTGVAVSEPGKYVEGPIPPTKSVRINWTPGDTSVAESGKRAHRHRTRRVDIPLDVDADAYVVVVVRADKGEESDMDPVVPGGGPLPFGFSNPLFVDADGGGYDNPPLADEAATPPDRSMMLEDADLDPHRSDPEDLTRDDLKEMLESFQDNPHFGP